MSIRYIGVYKTFYKKTKLVVYPPQEHIMIFLVINTWDFETST